jgi:hypothetical protein
LLPFHLVVACEPFKVSLTVDYYSSIIYKS